MRQDWIVVLYDADDRPYESFVIRDRTETEATHEAEADITVAQAADWTLTAMRSTEELA